ncbi:MAG: hypothetical protein V1909_00570 [Candidatus Micrarchaeota archaeon]
MKKNVYYAHPIEYYPGREERSSKKERAAICKIQGIFPNMKITNPAKFDYGPAMNLYLKEVGRADVVVIHELPQKVLSSGVVLEAEEALRRKIPVYSLTHDSTELVRIFSLAAFTKLSRDQTRRRIVTRSPPSRSGYKLLVDLH